HRPLRGENASTRPVLVPSARKPPITAISLPSRAAATSVRASGRGLAACHAELEAAADEVASANSTSASAGERTRTSKGFRPTGPKPVAFANSATPALGAPFTRRLQSRARGNEQGMTDEQDRERESRLTDENKFVEMTEEVADETRQAAERLATDPVVNEPPADEN